MGIQELKKELGLLNRVQAICGSIANQAATFADAADDLARGMNELREAKIPVSMLNEGFVEDIRHLQHRDPDTSFGSTVEGKAEDLLEELQVQIDSLSAQIEDWEKEEQAKVAAEESFFAGLAETLDAEQLDDLVHGVKLREASSVNNAGVDVQLEYLRESLGPEGLKAALKEIQQ